jgi:dTDP-glucose pyrophosphorylase
MEVIMPCAGLSTRFPNLRPKYLLTDYAGRLMIENAVKNYLGKHRITIVILAEHERKFSVRQKLIDTFGHKVDIIILENPTTGPADTVYQAIQKGRINKADEILIKDCDGFFDVEPMPGNVIYVSLLSDNPDIRNAPAKSYTITNEQNIVTTVVEKQIVSNSFCVGGYQFRNSYDYIEAFESLKGKMKSEIFVSNIIDYMISNGKIFSECKVNNFVDVGTADDWFKFNNKPTYFCDIDGTILMSADYNMSYEPLYDNVAKLKSELARGCQVVFCTARPKKYEELTRKILDNLGFADCQLVMGVNHSRRVLINDFAPSNPYPSAVAINLVRDADNLGDMI